MPGKRSLAQASTLVCGIALIACAGGSATESGSGSSAPATSPGGTQSSTSGALAVPAAPTSAGGTVTASPDGPRLSILDPVAGGTVTPPFAVRYDLAGWPGGAFRLRVDASGVAGHTLELAAPGQSGVVEVPDDKLFSGRHTLTFTVVRNDGSAVPSATAAIADLTIGGGR